MTTLQAAFLGVLQGFTEFLPISSSGHLAVTQKLMNLGDVPLLFDIILHIATLLAILIVFRKIIFNIFDSLIHYFGKRATIMDKNNIKLLLTVLFATVPTALIGVFLQQFHLEKNLHLVSFMFCLTGLILLLPLRQDPAMQRSRNPRFFKSFLIGIVQGLAVIPGISRSGSTITAGILLGLRRSKAGEFAFLMAVPAILGAFILKLKDLRTLTADVGLPTLLIGFVASFISGLLALKLLINLIKRSNLYIFSFYLIPLGLIGIFYFSR